MDNLPVVIRLLDPPLHEFVPEGRQKREELAKELNISLEELAKRADAIHETNPMMGHRGVRRPAHNQVAAVCGDGRSRRRPYLRHDRGSTS